MVVGLGGDGTVREVLDGFFHAAADGIAATPVREQAVLGVVRCGTGGDFGRGLGLPTKLPGAVAHLAGASSVPLDVGFLTHDDRTEAFLNIASFGVTGRIVEKVNASSKRIRGPLPFLWGTLRGIATYRRADVVVEVDGAVVHQGPLLCGAVANGRYFGGGMMYAPSAVANDGLLEVVLQTEIRPRDFLRAADVYQGRLSEWSTIRHARGRVVQVRARAGAAPPLEADGEVAGHLPAEFRVGSGLVRLKYGAAQAPAMLGGPALGPLG